MKRIIWFTLLFLSLLLALTPLAYAQEAAIQVQEQGVDSQFREEITAFLTAEHNKEITEVEFFYRLIGERATARNVAEFEPGETIEASFTINQDRQETYMPPGAEFEYWWKLTDADGNSLKTDPQTYLYLDNRYDFKTLSNDRLTLYWYSGGRAFGEALFKQANVGLDRLEDEIGVTIDRPIKIFIYGSHPDLISALSVAAQEWTGGVAFTEHGVVVLGIGADNLDWGLRAMTHEMTHLIIHQATDNPYNDLPRWLDEGLAVYNENPDELDEQFQENFLKAVKQDELFTLQTLSSTFPADSEAANLAYGQSGAVVGFIIRQYGPQAMQELLDIFSEGTLYDDALEEALGEDTKSLDNAFRANWDLPPLPGTAGESDAEQPKTGETKPEPAQAEPAQKTEPQQESPESRQEEASSSRGFRLPCIGGLLPLLLLGIIFTHRRRKLF